jgi:predicted ATP-grasp superfamily ATP-dependent carboligase
MLAQLATAAGYRVAAVDRFGDLDLRRLCGGRVCCEPPPRGGMAALVAAAEAMPAEAVVYGGGFENRPELVARLGGGRRLLGNAPDAIRRARDPAVLGGVLHAAGLAYPRTLAAAEATGSDRARAWLRKPLRSGGGRGIRRWDGAALGPGEVVQEQVPGLACSVAAVGDGRSAVVLGLSEQLVGERGFGGRGYSWCGNVVPPRLAAEERALLWHDAEAICRRLVAALGLRGVFGVDMVWDGRQAWVIEVNPRPPGSLEALELAGATGTFTAHVRAFDGALPRPRLEFRAPPRAAAKAILYATANTVVPDTRGWLELGIRDIPHPGERIAAGRPVCTLLAVAQTPEEALEECRRRAARLRSRLGRGVESHAFA